MRKVLIPISIATSVLFLTSSVAEQTPASTLSTQVVGLVQTQLDAQIANADTPEEAARIFMRAVSIGVSQVVADALPKSLNAVSKSSAFAANSKIAGWEKHALAGLNLDWIWASPDFLPMTQYVASVKTVSANPNPNPAAAGIDIGISIGVGIRF